MNKNYVKSLLIKIKIEKNLNNKTQNNFYFNNAIPILTYAVLIYIKI